MIGKITIAGKIVGLASPLLLYSRGNSSSFSQFEQFLKILKSSLKVFNFLFIDQSNFASYSSDWSINRKL